MEEQIISSVFKREELWNPRNPRVSDVSFDILIIISRIPIEMAELSKSQSLFTKLTNPFSFPSISQFQRNPF
jgi:hypothetical protein